MTFGTFPAAPDVAILVAAVNSTLTDRVDILRTAETLDATGAPVVNYVAAQTAVPARILPVGAEALRTREQIAGGALFDTTVFLCILPLGTALSNTDRVRKGTTLYEVVGTDANRSRNTSEHVMLKQLID